MKVGGDNYQDGMKVKGDSFQEGMEVGGFNDQEGMKVGGEWHKPDGTIVIHHPIN